MRPTSLLCSALLVVSALVAAVPAQAADEPYEIVVWADADYAASGELTSLEFIDAKDYPEPFLANLRSRIEAREYTAPVVDGQPARFETGVRVTITITPGAGGGQVKIDEIVDGARVLRMTAARAPTNVQGNQWSGVVLARCIITAKGRCNLADVVERSGLDGSSATSFAKGTLEGWRFKPQRVNGKPVESELIVPLKLEAAGVTRPVLRDRYE